MNERSQSPAEVWQTAYGELQLQLPRETFETWLRTARLIAHEDGTFIIGVHNIYAREWLEQRLKKVIVRTLSRAAQRVVEVRFVLAPEHRKDQEEETQKLADAGPLLASITPPEKEQPRFEQLGEGETGLNEQQTFDVYAVGACNRLAHAAAMSIVETPAAQFNPLYIHGGIGLGKSHLMHAIGNECYERGYRVVYATGETFTNDLVAAIRRRSTADFRDKYRTVDVLLIDDVQFIAGKESTQEEFYHTFNTLYDDGAQIVVASNHFPSEIAGMDKRILSRLSGGLTVELLPPDFLTRVDILEIKSRMRNLSERLSLDVLERIAEEIEGSVRELEGALNRVTASMLLTQAAPTLNDTEAILSELRKTVDTQRPAPPQLALEDIIMSTADYYGVVPEELIGRGRSRDVSIARQVAMYIAHEEADIPLQDIGDQMGGRNHSTVLYSCERVTDMMTTDSQVRREVQAIMRVLAPQDIRQRRD